MSNLIQYSDNFSKIPVATPTAISDNNNFKLSGASASCARSANGGVTLTTNASTDALAELIDVNTGGFGGTTWGVNNKLNYSALVQTPADITSMLIAVGMSDHPKDITAISSENLTQLDVAFVYESSLSANWQLMVMVGSGLPNTVIDSKIPVVASTSYNLSFKVDADRNILMYINGVQAYFNAVKLFPIDESLQPYAGVRGNSRSLTVSNITCSQQVA